MALVKSFFSLADGEFQLDKLFPSIQANGHQCQALRTGFTDERADLALPEKEFARAAVLVRRVPMGVGVARDERVGQIEFIPFDRDKGSFEARVTGFH